MPWITQHSTPTLLLNFTIFTLGLPDRQSLGGESISSLQPQATDTAQATPKEEEKKAEVENAKEDMIFVLSDQTTPKNLMEKRGRDLPAQGMEDRSWLI